MKRIVLALVLGLSLGGCAQLQKFQDALTLTTATVTNPVTKDRLNDLEAGIRIVFAGLKAYKSACINGTADVHCRTNIQQIQVYTRQVPVPLAQLRAFVKNNDQINATIVYNNLVTLITNAKQAAANAGINLGAS